LPYFSLSKSHWTDKEARLEFKSSISLEYTGITKQLVDTCSLKVSQIFYFNSN